MAYRPSLVVITLRDPSMSVGLAASTRTPGMAAPEGSLTCPEIVLCAKVVREHAITIARAITGQIARVGLGMRLKIYCGAKTLIRRIRDANRGSERSPSSLGLTFRFRMARDRSSYAFSSHA